MTESNKGKTLNVFHYDRDELGVLVEFRSEDTLLEDDADFWIHFRDVKEIDAVLEILFSARSALKVVIQDTEQLTMEGIVK